MTYRLIRIIGNNLVVFINIIIISGFHDNTSFPPIFQEDSKLNSTILNLKRHVLIIPFKHEIGGIMKRSQRDQKVSLTEPYDASTTTRYLELYVVNDHSQFLKYKRDFWEVVKRTKDIVNIINSIYRQVGIYIVLVGIEIWMDKDEIPIFGNSSETLHGFVEYKRKNISRKIKHDNAQLIVGKELGQGVIGKAPIRSMCSFESSAAVNEDRHQSAAAIATTIAHEIGHNFGLSHDLMTCNCPDNQCIMSSAGGGFDSFKYWSDCSKNKFSDVFKRGIDYCMHDLPKETYLGPTCGNGFKEGDEECDCGLKEDCDNKCCVALTCRLATNATCATGNCCNLETCQNQRQGMECRPSSNQCDLPEYCDGIQEFCPSDVFKHNGYTCREGREDSYCFNGNCQTHKSQCKTLWGYTGRVSEPICFEHFNLMGQVHGHCGYNWLDRKFISCAPQDVMCGMLHCEHEAKELSFWFNSMTLTMLDTYVMKNELKFICKAVIMDVGFMHDPGQVADGTKCGSDSMCLNSRCINVSYLNFPKCPENCNGNGICNTLGECHCNKGWAPPYCETKGGGGSIHSNSPGDKDTSMWVVALLCFISFMIIPAMMISAILIWKKHNRIKENGVGKRHQCFLGRSINPCLSQWKGSNFRTVGISNPLLQSSTNNNLVILSSNNSACDQKSKMPIYAFCSHPSNSLSCADKQIHVPIYANQIMRQVI